MKRIGLIGLISLAMVLVVTLVLGLRTAELDRGIASQEHLGARQGPPAEVERLQPPAPSGGEDAGDQHPRASVSSAGSAKQEVEGDEDAAPITIVIEGNDWESPARALNITVRALTGVRKVGQLVESTAARSRETVTGKLRAGVYEVQLSDPQGVQWAAAEVVHQGKPTRATLRLWSNHVVKGQVIVAPVMASAEVALQCYPGCKIARSTRSGTFDVELVRGVDYRFTATDGSLAGSVMAVLSDPKVDLNGVLCWHIGLVPTVTLVVEANGIATGDGVEVCSNGNAVASATFDSARHAEFHGLVSDSYLLQVKSGNGARKALKDGGEIVSALRVNARQDTHVALQCVPGRSLAGVVLDSKGQPVAGAVVGCQYYMRSEAGIERIAEMRAPPIQEACSDPVGRWELSIFDDAPWVPVIQATMGGLCSIPRTPGAGESDLGLSLVPGGMVCGAALWGRVVMKQAQLQMVESVVNGVFGFGMMPCGPATFEGDKGGRAATYVRPPSVFVDLRSNGHATVVIECFSSTALDRRWGFSYGKEQFSRRTLPTESSLTVEVGADSEATALDVECADSYAGGTTVKYSWTFPIRVVEGHSVRLALGSPDSTVESVGFLPWSMRRQTELSRVDGQSMQGWPHRMALSAGSGGRSRVAVFSGHWAVGGAGGRDVEVLPGHNAGATTAVYEVRVRVRDEAGSAIQGLSLFIEDDQGGASTSVKCDSDGVAVFDVPRRTGLRVRASRKQLDYCLLKAVSQSTLEAGVDVVSRADSPATVELVLPLR